MPLTGPTTILTLKLSIIHLVAMEENNQEENYFE